MQCPIYKHALRPKVSSPKIATREATVELKFPEVLLQVFTFITELKGRENKFSIGMPLTMISIIK